MTALPNRKTRITVLSRIQMILHLAGVPLYSQMCQSVAVFLGTAMLSRAATALNLSTILACYSIQSISMAWGRQALVVARVQRYSDEIFPNDIRHIMSWASGTAIVQVFLSIILATAFTKDPYLGLAVAVWVGSSVFVDILRFAAARFDSRPERHAASATAQMLFSYVFFAFAAGSVSATMILVVMAGSNVLFALLYLLGLKFSQSEGVSWFSAAHGRFARNFGFETASSAFLQSCATVLLTAFSPNVAVGVLLIYQVLGTPTGMVSQALSSSLGRLVRESMLRNFFPAKVLIAWVISLCVGTGVISLLIAGPLVGLLIRLFGENWNHTAPLLPGLTLYFCGMYLVQVLSLPTRWWVSSHVIRNWMIGAVVVFYIGLLLSGTLFITHLTVATCVSSCCYLLLAGTRVALSFANQPERFRWVS